jgi:putative Holliday junction resolvase
MRTLAIDLGTRRVGLALSDESGRLATAYDVLSVSGPEAAIQPVCEVVRKESVRRIVVGLPLNMDGTPGPAAEATIAWARRLAAATAVPVIFVDERLSSFAAEQDLLARRRAGQKLTRRQRRQRLDALAAARFLQDFLDGKLPPISVAEDRPPTQNDQRG